MKKVPVKIITISSLALVTVLFLAVLFSKYDGNNSLALVAENNNLSKMDDNTSIRFNESLKEVDGDSSNENKDNKDESKKDESSVSEVIENITVVNEEKNEIVVESIPESETIPVTSLSEERTVLQTVVGNLTGYGPDCVGCGGHTSTGFDLTQSIYYEDSEFGTVRILAADKSFPFYSIIRVSNVPSMDDFIGIVLDRGGNVGYGRGTLFDLAFESESSPNLIPLTHNVTFELLRSGR